MHTDHLAVAALAPGEQGQHHSLEQGSTTQQAEKQGQQQAGVIQCRAQYGQPVHHLLHEGMLHDALWRGQNNAQQRDRPSQGELRQSYDHSQDHDGPEAALQRWRQGVINTLKGLYELGFQHDALFYR